MDNPQEPKDEIEQKIADGGGAGPVAPADGGAGNGGGAGPVAPADGGAGNGGGAGPVAPADGGAGNGGGAGPVAPADGGAGNGGGAGPAAPADGGAGNGGGAGPAAPADGGAGNGGGAGPAAPADGGAGNGGGAGPAAPAGGGAFQTVDLKTATPSKVPDTHVVVSEVKASPGMTIGKKLTLWMLSILAGSILLLMLYLWEMERTAGNDIRRNYGKDLNSDNVSLYMGQRIQRFSNDLANAQNNPLFAAPKKNVADDKALSDTLGLLPDITVEQRSQLMTCVSLISSKEATGADRKTKLQPCVEFLQHTKDDGTTAATAAMSFEMASEASAKLLEERQNLHEFWLKAAQLILLNLLLPVLTAVIGYTFGNNQANQSQGSSQQGSSQ